MKSTLKIVLLLVVIQLTMQAGFDCSVEGCALCTYPDMCGQCNNNWVLMQNSTTGAFYCNKINCVDNCDSCYEDNVCQTCSTGFFLTSSGGCSSTQTSSTQLPPYCNWGYSAQNCTMCMYGSFYIQSGFCYPVIAKSYQDMNCMIKMTPSMCQLCKAGYIVNNLGMCVQNMVNQTCLADNCAYCQNANNTCTMCNSGYQVSSSNVCEPLPCNITGCQMCSNSTSCMTCGEGYVSSGNTCVAAQYGCNVANCEQCGLAYQSCSLCNLGYELAPFAVGSNTVNMCIKIVCPFNVTNCNYCAHHYNEVTMFNQIMCEVNSCMTGYIHVNGYCVANVTGTQYDCTVNWCNQCSFNNFCSVCQNGYTLTTFGTCQKTVCNVQNCNSCNLNNICSACNTGYSLTGNIAIVSPNDMLNFDYALKTQCTMQSSISCDIKWCNYCSSDNVCAGCMTGYDFNNNQTSCVPNCNVTNCYQCNEGQDKTCDVCSPAYQLSSDQLSCTPMPTDCGNWCSNSTGSCIYNWVSNSSQCVQCMTGYTLFEGTCYQQNCTLAGCEVCANWRTEVTCIQCKQGLFPTFNGQCIQLNCDSTTKYCANCVENGKCLGCMEGYLYQNVSGTISCVKQSTIASCSVSNCLACTSTSTTTCETCAEPYVLNSATGTCVCKWQNCMECGFSVLACSACTPNLLATIKEPNCIPYPSLKLTCSVQNCEFCLTPNQCSVCALGYHLDSSDFSCNINNCSTLSNCQLCDEYAYECHQCQTGYQVDNQLEGGSCFQINSGYTCDIQGCGVCSYSNNSVCASCLPYYYMSNGTCVANECDFSNCYFCLENGVCTVCTAGFYLNNDGQCQAVSTAITSCSSNIAFCLMCMQYTNNGTQTCYQCLGGFEYDSASNACVPQTNTIEYCKYQISNLYGLPTCLICTQGYYINSWGTCSQYSPTLANTGCSVYNCLHCDQTDSCSFCFIPWGISTTGKCQTNITDICQDTNCSQCANSSFCLTCVDTMRPYLGECLTCDINGCDYCKVVGTCSKCMDNYDLLSNGLCISCDIQGCTSCSDNNVCQTCTNSSVALYPSANRAQCVQCNNDNCAYCSSDNSCGVCMNRYQLWPLSSSSTQNCITCKVENCNTCKSNNFCYSCATGYSTTSNGTCISCNTPCATCNSDGSCNTCQTPFYASTPNSNGNCFVSTVPNCNQYNSSSTSTCLGCSTGYTLNSSDNTCMQNCVSSCATCSNTNSTQCLTCPPGFYIKSNSCMACQDDGCSNCNTNSSQCTTCMDGYYNLNGQCKNCPGYCLTCSSATVCTALIDSSSQTLVTDSNGNTVLAVCNQGCVTCSSSNPQICIKCNNGYYLSNGICKLCSSSCKSCSSTSPDECSSCYPNSFLSSTTCTTCSSNCLTCESANNFDVCTSCKQGSFLSQSKCVTGCSSNCLYCSSKNTCTQCASGYTLFSQSSSTVCASCISSCRTCVKGQPANCLSCGDGFYLNNGVCVSCPSNCQSCTSLVCTTCMTGYFQSGPNTCSAQCSLPCATCSASNPSKCLSCIAGYSYSSTSNTCNKILSCNGACSVCPLGYVLNQGTCIECTGNNCQSCSSGTLNQCDSCMNGYYLNSTNNQCVSCSSSCATCQSADGCTTCASGLTATEASLVGSTGIICTACSSPCATCVNSPTTCTTCMSGFTFNGWKCVKTFHFAFSLTLQTTQTTFNTNYFSFLLALAQALGSTETNIVTIFSISFGSVVVQGAVNPSAGSATKSANNQYSSLYATVAKNNNIAGMAIVDSSVTVNGGSIDYDDVDLALILGICIPVGILLIVGIALFVYCKKKKSSDIIEQRIKEDSGFTVRESFQLSNQYKDDDTGRGFEQTTAIN